MSSIFLEKELSLQDKMLYNFVADDLTILFVMPHRYRGLSYLVKTKKAKLSVLDTNLSFASLAKQQGATLINGDVYDTMPLFGVNQFDLVIMDDILLSYVDIELVLDYVTSAGKYCLISITNYTRLKNRLSFLFSGNVFDKREKENWLKPQNLHICSGTDFLQLCFRKNFSVKRACFYESGLKIQNIYNVVKFPNLTAKKFYFMISK